MSEAGGVEEEKGGRETYAAVNFDVGRAVDFLDVSHGSLDFVFLQIEVLADRLHVSSNFRNFLAILDRTSCVATSIQQTLVSLDGQQTDRTHAKTSVVHDGQERIPDLRNVAADDRIQSFLWSKVENSRKRSKTKRALKRERRQKKKEKKKTISWDAPFAAFSSLSVSPPYSHFLFSKRTSTANLKRIPVFVHV